MRDDYSPIVGFGKYRNERAADCPLTYWAWMADNCPGAMRGRLARWVYAELGRPVPPSPILVAAGGDWTLAHNLAGWLKTYRRLIPQAESREEAVEGFHQRYGRRDERLKSPAAREYIAKAVGWWWEKEKPGE